MTMHISISRNREKIHNAAADTTQACDFVACPECSMTASVQWGDRLESTNGPVDHVRVTCVNRHWFFMPADSLTLHAQNYRTSTDVSESASSRFDPAQ